MTPTDRLSGFGTGLATNSDSVERVPRGHSSQYSDPNGSARASFFRSLATQENVVGDRDIRLAWSTSSAGSTRARIPQFLCTPHTNQLRCMVGYSGPLPSPLHL